MTDQHHFQALGAAGNQVVKTPNLDRLASAGVRFTHAFSTVPYCSPTRASLVTGLFPSTLGIGHNIPIGPRAGQDPARIRDPQVTYMQRLADQGYGCHQVGKWHLGVTSELKCFADPKRDLERPQRIEVERVKAAGDSAFDRAQRPGEVELFANKNLAGVWMRQAVADGYHLYQKGFAEGARQDLGVMGRSVLKLDNLPETAQTDYAIELMKEHKAAGKPFAITWSVTPPHEPFVAPAPYYDLYDPASFKLPASWSDQPAEFAKSNAARQGEVFGEGGVREYLRCYYARVTMMDTLIGRLLDSLDQLGLADNTLVVFTSDHGNLLGQHHMIEKGTEAFYDDLIRVPLLMRWPGHIAPGLCESVASSVDVPPTILDYLGGQPLAGIHGRSLRRVVEGTAREADRAMFGERGILESQQLGRVVRTADWKLAIHPNVKQRAGPLLAAAELYDLKNDPGETHNAIAEPARREQVRTLLGLLLAHMKVVGDPALERVKAVSATAIAPQ